MTTWVIISWVFVALLTAGNIFFFLKLKGASEQMMKTAFPGAKNMADAMKQMQGMMAGMKGGMPGGLPGSMPGKTAKPVKSNDMNAQLKSAMDMLAQTQRGSKKK